MNARDMLEGKTPHVHLTHRDRFRRERAYERTVAALKASGRTPAPATPLRLDLVIDRKRRTAPDGGSAAGG